MTILRQAMRRSAAELALFLHAAALHAAVAIALRACSFRRVLATLDAAYPLRAPGGSPARARWAASRAAWYSPLPPTCLTESLMARCLLRRAGVDATLCIGVATRTSDGFAAHAWLEPPAANPSRAVAGYSTLFTS
jgi:hypothetical protein